MATKSVFERRRARNRYRLKKVAGGRPRLSVHRTAKHIYAQVIDDTEGRTLAAASTMDADMRKDLTNGGNADAAVAVGKAVAEKAVKAGVSEVVFDRGGYLFHGRVKALADAAREAGLKF